MLCAFILPIWLVKVDSLDVVDNGRMRPYLIYYEIGENFALINSKLRLLKSLTYPLLFSCKFVTLIAWFVVEIDFPTPPQDKHREVYAKKLQGTFSSREEEKTINSFCNYYSLDEMIHKTLYLKQGGWEIEVVPKFYQ